MKGGADARRAAYVALAFCWACWLFNFMSRFLVSISLPMVEAELAIPHALAGLLVTAMIVSYSVSTIPAGLLSRRAGAKRTIVAFLLLSAATYLVIWWAHGYAAVLASMVLLGTVLGMYLPSAVALLSGWFAGCRLGVVLGIHETAVSAGKIVGAVAVGTLVARWGEWRISFLALVPVVVGLALWSVWVGERQAPASRQPRRAPARRRYRRALWYIAPYTLNLFVSFGTFAMLTVYLEETFALDLGTASAVFALVHVGGLVGVVIGGALSDRFGREFAMLLLLSMSTVALVCIYLLPFGAPLVVLWAMVNFTSTAFFPVTFAYLSDVAAPASPAPLVGLFTGVGTLVGGISPALIGAVGDAFGLRAGMLFPAALGATGMAMLVALRGGAGRPAGERRDRGAGYK